MKNKTRSILIVLALLVVVIFVMRFWSGDEDSWLCQDGEWVMHGKPNSAKPQTACGTEKVAPKIDEEKMVDKKPENKEVQKPAEELNIRISTPSVDSVITSPVKIAGEAKGWYFEASFPVKLVDENGNVLATGLAQAKSDWMQDAYVPFESELTFNSNGTRSGKIIFEKDNPSGLLENAGSFSLPVLFEK